MVCPACGVEQQDAFHRLDEAYPCANCGTPTEHVWRGKTSNVIGDEWPGGGPKTFENLGHEPVTCQYKSDLKKELDKRDLQHFVRHVDGDKHVSDWSMALTKEALEKAVELVSRRASPGTLTVDDTIPCETARFSVQEWNAK